MSVLSLISMFFYKGFFFVFQSVIIILEIFALLSYLLLLKVRFIIELVIDYLNLKVTDWYIPFRFYINIVGNTA